DGGRAAVPPVRRRQRRRSAPGGAIAPVTGLAIESRGLRKDFGATTAVHDLTLTVGRGEVFGFLGPNGAGKTTSMKMLLGLVRPSAGAARLLGAPVGDVATRARVGFLPEHCGFHDCVTGGAR